MLYLVAYDVRSNRVRAKMARLLEQKGLTRVQYSVFIGLLTEPAKEKLLHEIGIWTISLTNFHFLCIPLHQNVLSALHEVTDEPLDWEYLKGTKSCLVF